MDMNNIFNALTYKNLIFFIIAIVVIVLLISYLCEKILIFYDNSLNYSKKKLKTTKFIKDGNTYIFIKCKKWTQPNKYLQLQKYKQASSIFHGNQEFKISEIVSETYKYKSKNREFIGILYKVVSVVEEGVSNVVHGDVYAPVQMAGSNSQQIQEFTDTHFKTIVNEYKNDMIKQGIPEKDIEALINFSNDTQVKKSFISKYAIELAGITVDLSGIVLTLYELLNK